MTRKDYNRMAAILGTAFMEMDNGTPTTTILVRLRHDIADMLQDDNPRFDRNRFIDAVSDARLGRL